MTGKEAGQWVLIALGTLGSLWLLYRLAVMEEDPLIRVLLAIAVVQAWCASIESRLR